MVEDVLLPLSRCVISITLGNGVEGSKGGLEFTIDNWKMYGEREEGFQKRNLCVRMLLVVIKQLLMSVLAARSCLESPRPFMHQDPNLSSNLHHHLAPPASLLHFQTQPLPSLNHAYLILAFGTTVEYP